MELSRWASCINCKLLIVLLLFQGGLVATVFGQDSGESSRDRLKDTPLNTITVGIGRANNITEGVKFSNLGFDYLRRFHPSWEYGIQLDLEWEKGFTSYEGTQAAAIIVYSINPKWPVFGGLGVAVEEHHTDGFLRFGTEYTFFFNDLWFIAPGTFIDISTEDVSPSIMLAVGINW